MRIYHLFLIVFTLTVFAACNDKKEKDPLQEEFLQLMEDEEAVAQTESENAIVYDPRYTYQEWIISLSDRLFNEDSVEVLGLMELDLSEENIALLFAVELFEGPAYFTLIQKPDDSFDFQSVTIDKNSVLNTYGRQATASVYIYKLQYYDVDGDEVPEILASAEINGMTEAPDGMLPFTKIQHDVLTFDNGMVSFDAAMTKGFNEDLGVDMAADTVSGLIALAGHKYFEPIDKTYRAEEMKVFLKDLGIIKNAADGSATVFIPVRKQETGDYVLERGYNFYEARFLNEPSSSVIIEVDPADYPVFYVEDHGDYVYSIEQTKIDDDIIVMTLDRLYAKDEITGELDKKYVGTSTITLKLWQKKWVLTYESNPLMIKKDTEGLVEVNSNEGQ